MKKRLLLFLFAMLTTVSAWAFEVDGLYYQCSYGEAETTVSVVSGGNGAYSGNVIIPSTVDVTGRTLFFDDVEGGQKIGGWGNSSTIEVVDDNGGKAYKLTNPSVVNPWEAQTAYDIDNAFEDGVEYTVEFDAKATAAYKYTIGLQNAEDNYRDCGNTSVDLTTDWQHFKVTIKCKGDGAKRFIMGYGDLEGSIYLDNFSIKVNSNQIYYVTSIGREAFSGCSSLTSVTIPSSVTEIGSSAFRGCSGLTSVVIPSSVTWIGSSAFYDCSGLTSVVIPSSVTSIGYGCSITRIDYTGSLEEWCNKQWNPSYISYSYDLYINGKKVEGELVIPSSVTEIGYEAFYGCSGLTSVVIPSSVTEIGSSAFYGCRGLTSVVIPSSVTSIGNYAFHGCGLTSVTIPEGVTEIASSAFSSCRSLTSVVIPSSVTEIASSAFSGCDGLTSVTIPEGVTEIGESAFLFCNNLTSVEIPSSVTSIGSSAFDGCNNLTSVTIPSTVTVIGSYAFPSPYDNEECKLNTITLLTKTNQPALAILGDYTASYFHSKGYAAVYVADGLLPFYEWFWGGFYNFIEIGDVPNVINGEGGIASIVKVYNNKVDINVDLEEGYSVSEIKVNGNVVYPASSGNKALSADVSVIKNSETSFTLVGVTADDTIEVAYNKSTPTPVGVIEMQREVKGIYDIYGRKLSAPQRGINIIDGKKVIVK